MLIQPLICNLFSYLLQTQSWKSHGWDQSQSARDNAHQKETKEVRSTRGEAQVNIDWHRLRSSSSMKCLFLTDACQPNTKRFVIGQQRKLLHKQDSSGTSLHYRDILGYSAAPQAVACRQQHWQDRIWKDSNIVSRECGPSHMLVPVLPIVQTFHRAGYSMV